jgi:heme/copper-type cytochrome/quinol oxidase subunit 3
MNSNAYIVSGIIAFVFLVAKFAEMRFTNSNSSNSNNNSGEEDEAPAQSKPLKFLMRDALLVYVSSLIGFYVISQFEDHSVNSAVKEVAAFTGGPDF